MRSIVICLFVVLGACAVELSSSRTEQGIGTCVEDPVVAGEGEGPTSGVVPTCDSVDYVQYTLDFAASIAPLPPSVTVTCVTIRGNGVTPGYHECRAEGFYAYNEDTGTWMLAHAICAIYDASLSGLDACIVSF